MADLFGYYRSRGAQWATYAGAEGSFTVASANTGYVAVPRYINGIASAGA